MNDPSHPPPSSEPETIAQAKKRLIEEIWSIAHTKYEAVKIAAADDAIDRLLAAVVAQQQDEITRWRGLYEYADRLRRDTQEALHAAEAVVAQQGHWQPIETAPKDGTVVLLCEPPELKGSTLYGNVVPAYWKIDKHYAAGGCWTDGNWVVVPTHWQPFPDPPLTAQTPGEPT